MKTLFCSQNLKLDQDLSIEKAGFRPNLSTVEHTVIVKQLIRKSKNYKDPLCLMSIDFRNTFDSLLIIVIIWILFMKSADKHKVKIILKIYEKAKAIFEFDGVFEEIKIRALNSGT